MTMIVEIHTTKNSLVTHPSNTPNRQKKSKKKKKAKIEFYCQNRKWNGAHVVLTDSDIKTRLAHFKQSEFKNQNFVINMITTGM